MSATEGTSFLQHGYNRWLAIAPESEMHKPAFFDEPLQSVDNAGVTALRGHRTDKENLVGIDADNQNSEVVIIVGVLGEAMIPRQQWNGPLRRRQ